MPSLLTYHLLIIVPTCWICFKKHKAIFICTLCYLSILRWWGWLKSFIRMLCGAYHWFIFQKSWKPVWLWLFISTNQFWWIIMPDAAPFQCPTHPDEYICLYVRTNRRFVKRMVVYWLIFYFICLLYRLGEILNAYFSFSWKFDKTLGCLIALDCTA